MEKPTKQTIEEAIKAKETAVKSGQIIIKEDKPQTNENPTVQD